MGASKDTLTRPPASCPFCQEPLDDGPVPDHLVHLTPFARYTRAVRVEYRTQVGPVEIWQCPQCWRLWSAHKPESDQEAYYLKWLAGKIGL